MLAMFAKNISECTTGQEGLKSRMPYKNWKKNK